MIVVIGSGLAGLTAAITLLEAGHRVTLVAKGPGGLQLSQGSIDIMGYQPDLLSDPLSCLDDLPEHHPYHHFTAEQIADSVQSVATRLTLMGNAHTNMVLPTAVGALRPTAFAPASSALGDARHTRNFAVVGIRQIKDFQADLIAGNLDRTTFDGQRLRATSAWVDMEAREGEVDSSPTHYAQALDDDATLNRFASLLKKVAGDGDVIVVPAVIGLKNPHAHDELTRLVGRPVAEITTPPPGIPGLRMYNELLTQARSLGVRHIQGALVTGFTADAHLVTHVTVASAGHDRKIRCDAVVYAPGGFESGSLAVDSYGAISERVFHLPLTAANVSDLLKDDVFSPQPLYAAGVRVDEHMRPVGDDGVVFSNLYAAGGILAGAVRWVEKSGDGIAVASALRAAELGGTR